MNVLLSVLVLAFALISNSAFATEARTTIFGTGGVTDGSLWVNDESNIFYNPVYVTEHNNYLILEKGLGGGGVAKFGDLSFGVFLGRTTTNMTTQGFTGFKHNDAGAATFSDTALTAGVTAANLNARPVDLFIGGDTGIKWGLGLHVNMAKATLADNGVTYLNPSYSQLDLTLGAEIAGFKPFISYGLSREIKMDGKGTVQGADVKLAADSIISEKEKPLTIGLQYEIAGFTPYAVFNTTTVDATGYVTATDKSYAIGSAAKGTSWTVGTAKAVEMKNGKVFLGLGVMGTKATLNDGSNTGVKTEVSTLAIPVMAGVEASPVSWLVARAAAQYDLTNRQTSNSTSNVAGSKTLEQIVSKAGTVQAGVGATIKLGNFDIDSVVGNLVRDSGFTGNAFAKIGVIYHL